MPNSIDLSNIEWDDEPQQQGVSTPDLSNIDWDDSGDSKTAQQADESVYDQFKQKMSEYGKKLAYDLGIGARWGVEGAARAIGSFSDPLGHAMGKLPGVPEYTGSLEDTVSKGLTKIGLPEETERYEVPGEIMRTVNGAAVGAGGASGVAKGATGLTKQVSKALAAQPGQQLAGAAGASAGQQLAEKAGFGPVAQATAGLAGGVLGAGATGVKAQPRVVGKGVEEAENLGIRAMTSDAIKPRTFLGKAGQAAGERIPIAGTGSMRKAQQVSRINAVKKLLSEYGIDEDTMAYIDGGSPSAIDDVMGSLSAKRSADLTKYTGWKKDIFKKLNDEGTVPVDKTVSTIDKEITKLKEVSESLNKPAIDLFEQFKEDIQGKTINNVEGLREALGQVLAKNDSLASVKKVGEKAAGRIYKVLREDMGDFIEQKGSRQDRNVWSKANKELSEMMGELDVNVLKSTLKSGKATPELVKRMLFSKKPSDIKLLYKNLDTEGRASARIAIMQEAAERSKFLENNSPDRFINNVKRLGKSTGIFFKKDELNRVRGLARAIDFTKRAGEFAAHPPTGAQTIPYIGGAILTDWLGSAGAATATAGGIGLAARTFESRPVRNILMRLPSVKKGSPEEAQLVKRLFALIQTKQGDE
jgi:hypothetical protein